MKQSAGTERMIEAFTTVAGLARQQWLRTLQQIRQLPEYKRS